MVSSRYGLEIRAATSADASGLSELLTANGYAISSAALARRLDAAQGSPGTVLGAWEWGPPSGLVVLHWYRTLVDDQLTAQITTLLVDSDARRRGIGRLLVKAAAQAARVAGCGGLQLTAPENHADLDQFCRATGFALSGPQYVRGLRKRSDSTRHM